MRIAICGVHIEASTFSPHHSTAADFEVRRGDQIVNRYRFLAPGSPLRERADYVGILHARALPGGAVTANTYQGFRDEIVRGLAEQGPFDGILFDIHGAMSVQGLEDAEGDLLTAVRQVVGPEVLVSAPMDLHGNVSETLFDGLDLLTCYRTAPHLDVWETRERALVNLLDALESPTRPYKALVHVPVLLPGEMTSTRLEPAASLYARVPEIEQTPGVIDAAIWIGYAWADEPRCKAAIVVTGTDAATVEHEALQLGREFWAARHDFQFVAPVDSFEACLDAALASSDKPFLISDSGDNPGAGGADDCTHTLAALAAAPRIASGEQTALLVSIVDPDTALAAAALGEGATGNFTVGGRIDTRPPGPQTITARVAQVAHDPRVGTIVRLVVQGQDGDGGLHLVVTECRTQYATAAQFDQIGVAISDYDIVVVKMGYLEPDLFAAQRGWLLALTPGGVDQDLQRLGHRHIDRPMIPFDAEVPMPDVVTRRGGGQPRKTGAAAGVSPGRLTG